MSVRKGLGLLLAFSALSFLAACGGSSAPHVNPPPTGAFGNNNLSGTYVVSIFGFDFSGNGSSFALAGTISANGSGSITGGTIDLNDPALAIAIGSGTFAQTGIAVTGNYKVTSDGRGNGTINFTFDGQNQTFGIDFVITQNGHGSISRFDGNGSGSGTLDLQTSATQASLASLAFSLAGSDSGGLALATVGGFTLDGTGNVTSGTQDFNDDGGATTALDLTNPGPSSFVLPAGSATGSAQLTTSALGALTFDFFVIDGTHLKIIETDATGNVLAGDAFTQQTSVTAGNFAFTVGGQDSVANPFVAGGLLTVDSSGGITGIEDFNDSGTLGTQTTLVGSCVLTAGRCQIAFTDFSNGNGSLQTFQFAAYPSSGGILLLEVDNLGLTTGAALAQSSTAISTPQGYGLNLAGIDISSGSLIPLDEIAEFTAQSLGSNGSGAIAGIIDVNDGGPVTAAQGQSLGTSNFTPDSPATGRGSISTTNAFASLEYYTVDNSNILFIDGDATQIGLGSMQIQNTSSSPALAATAPAATLLHQVNAARASLQKRKKTN